MSENQKIVTRGNEAVGWGALCAGCDCFFGYPITPQNEIIEWFAREYPKRGLCFLQGESEWSVAAMLLGASAAGARVMTSTSSPGWGLMQEIISNIAAAELPCVIVDVQRGGPGQGTTQHAQMDYLSATRGGHGGYKNIVLGANSVQENCDLVQLAFYLADKYRNQVIVLTDAIIGQMFEKLEVRTLEFGPLPPKDWALKGHIKKGARFDMLLSGRGMIGPYRNVLADLQNKWQRMAQEEVRYETYREEDAELLLVAYGYASRVCKDAVDQARSDSLRVGLIRPITLWPFPYEVIRQQAARGAKFLVVEDSLGQMVEDVRMVVGYDGPVHFVGALDRHLPTASGMIMPDRVLEVIRKISGVRR